MVMMMTMSEQEHGDVRFHGGPLDGQERWFDNVPPPVLRVPLLEELSVMSVTSILTTEKATRPVPYRVGEYRRERWCDSGGCWYVYVFEPPEAGGVRR